MAEMKEVAEMCKTMGQQNQCCTEGLSPDDFNIEFEAIDGPRIRGLRPGDKIAWHIDDIHGDNPRLHDALRRIKSDKRAKANSWPVLITKYKIYRWGDEVWAWGPRYSGIVTRENPPKFTFAHEFGHVMHWTNKKTYDVHSDDAGNLMYVTGGSKPDCQYCTLFAKYAK